MLLKKNNKLLLHGKDPVAKSFRKEFVEVVMRLKLVALKAPEEGGGRFPKSATHGELF